MSGDTIIRNRPVNGFVTPAFIHNGGSFFFINLPVYADGLVDCWELLDLSLFQEKVKQGWVVTAVPDGEAISIHGLGQWQVMEGEWTLDAEALHARVVSLVRRLNPRMENLHDCHGRTTEPVGNTRVSILGMSQPLPIRGEHSPLARAVKGEQLSLFVRQKPGATYLADLRVFPDGTVELGRLPEPLTLRMDALEAEGTRGTLLTQPAQGERIHIQGLGSFTLGEEHFATALQDVLGEVRDRFDTLNGRPTSSDRARSAYAAYLAAPSEQAREALQAAYEAVPEHLRMFLGDMDTKDIPLRMVIYGDEELEEWSHRAVARSEGLPLPDLEVPRPVSNPALLKQVAPFVDAARAFVEFVDTAHARAEAERPALALRRLTALYGAALDLPDVAPGDFEAPEKPTVPPEWPGFGERDFYFEVFDPYVDEPAVTGSLSDDCLDIFRDLRQGLSLLEAGRVEAAVWTWRFAFHSHWGDHASDALRALHRVLTAGP